MRLKNTIENLLPQRVRERKRQMEVAIAEECAKKPRTMSVALSEVLAAHDMSLPYEGAVSFERTGAVGLADGQHLRAQAGRFPSLCCFWGLFHRSVVVWGWFCCGGRTACEAHERAAAARCVGYA